MLVNIGSEIKHYRKAKGLTQKQLGTLLGSTQQMIAQYESGKHIPKVDTVNKIAKALDVDPFSLYSFDMASEVLSKHGEKGNRINNLFHQLNDTGQDKAIEQVEMLTKIPEYRKEGTTD